MIQNEGESGLMLKAGNDFFLLFLTKFDSFLFDLYPIIPTFECLFPVVFTLQSVYSSARKICYPWRINIYISYVIDEYNRSKSFLAINFKRSSLETDVGYL